MKTFIKNLFSALLISGSLFSCKSVDSIDPTNSTIEAKLDQAGFSSKKLFEGKDPSGKDGYYVEGDIFVAKERIDSLGTVTAPSARTAQYRTILLVTSLPRVITIKLATTLPQVYISATDEMIKRYNALGLLLTFKRIKSGTPTINIVKDESLPVGVFATAGFPYTYGAPYGYIKIKTGTFGSTTDVQAVASLIAHEMGHCIGLRHSDWKSRCDFSSEQAGTNGAILIPYTPTYDEKSYMLSCGLLVDVPFSDNDKIALYSLYGKPVIRY